MSLKVDIQETIYDEGNEVCLLGKVRFPESRHPVDILLYKRGTSWGAITRYCPHRAADFYGLKPDEQFKIHCPLHSRQFSLFGEHGWGVSQSEGDFYINEHDADTQVIKVKDLEHEIQVLKNEIETLNVVVEAQESHLIDVTQELDAMVTSLNDRTEIERRKSAELLEMQRYVEDMINSLEDIILSTDTVGNIEQFNHALTTTFKVDQSSLIGSNIDQLFPAEYLNKLRLTLKNVNSEQSLIAQYFRRQSGHPEEIEMHGRMIQVRSAVRYSRAGKEQGLVFTIVDVSELHEAIKKAKEASVAKSMFLANMSHEIRTPLNAIIGTSYLLKKDKLTENQRLHVETIDISSKNLLSLINDILDISKIEANEMLLDEYPFSLRRMMSDLRKMFDPLMREKHLQFLLQAPASDMPDVFLGDENRIRQMLINLLNNARKFTSEGRISIGVSEVARDNDWVRIRFEVEDSGIGIPEDKFMTIFQPFQQADVSTTRRFGGTGLGLSIVKQMTEQMGGKVELSSRLGVGSIFSIELPLKLSSSQVEKDNINQPDLALYLIIIGKPTERRSRIEYMSEDFGWECAVFDHLDAFKQQLPLYNQRPLLADCVIFSDGPDKSGRHEFSEMSDVVSPDQMPTVLLTMDDNQSFECPSHPFIEVFPNTFDHSVLFDQVNDIVASRFGYDYVLQRTSTLNEDDIIWLSSVNLMIVDDIPLNLFVAKTVLAHHGASAETFDNPLLAIERLSQSDAEFDAILMDVQMPEIDGCEAAARIRNVLGLKKIPIIALTAGAMASDRENAINSGMNAFLTKPIEAKSLIRTVREQIELYRQRAWPTHRRVASSPENGSLSAKENDQSSSTVTVDIETALENLSGMKDLYIDIAKSFTEDLEATEADLIAKIQSQRYGEASKKCHSLKGLLRQLGIGNESLFFADLEVMMREASNIDDPQGTIDKIKSTLASCHQAIIQTIDELSN